MTMIVFLINGRICLRDSILKLPMILALVEMVMGLAMPMNSRLEPIPRIPTAREMEFTMERNFYWLIMVLIPQWMIPKYLENSKRRLQVLEYLQRCYRRNAQGAENVLGNPSVITCALMIDRRAVPPKTRMKLQHNPRSSHGEEELSKMT